MTIVEPCDYTPETGAMTRGTFPPLDTKYIWLCDAINMNPRTCLRPIHKIEKKVLIKLIKRFLNNFQSDKVDFSRMNNKKLFISQNQHTLIKGG